MAAPRKKPTPKRGASRYQAPPKKPVPGWVWMVCGLVIGGFVVMLMNLEPGRDEVKRDRSEPKRSTAQGTAKPDAGGGSQAAKPKYDFYTLLPESEVIVPPDAAPVPPPALKPVTPEEAAKIDTARAQAALSGKTPPPAPPVQVATAPTPAPTAKQTTPPLVASAAQTQYFLQAGSFRKAADADRVRAQIILLGQSVQVESGTVREETWYRVLVGPFANREQLNGAQKSLAASGFGNLLLQQRQKR